MKNILIDFSVFQFKAIFAKQNPKFNSNIPATYTAMSMILNCLKLVDANKHDRIFFALDSKKGSWRKKIDPNYKANRKQLREKTGINWNEEFKWFDYLKRNLSQNTTFKLIEIDELEADDLISYICRYYKDEECIVISIDSDYEQLALFDNVKLFSPSSKKFKTVANPAGILEKKIKKERADNLISPIQSEEDREKRKLIVNLLQLPDFVEEKIKKTLENLPECDIMIDYDNLNFKSLHKRYADLFEKEVETKGQISFI